jgi:hypothetical protein
MKQILTLTGSAGLTTKYQGDLHDTTPQPHLRYTGEEGEMAYGIYNPFKKYGYLAPANKTYTAITGTITNPIRSAVYDAVNNKAYFVENQRISELSGLDDTSLAQTLAIDSSMSECSDLELYELNGTRVLLYTGKRGNRYDTFTVSFYPLDENSGPSRIDSKVIETGTPTLQQPLEATGVTKFAQRFRGTDARSPQKARLRMGASLISTNYNFRVSIQTNSGESPSGTVIASVTKSTSILKAINKDGSDIYFDFGSEVPTTPGVNYWLVVEPVNEADLSNGSIFLYSTTSNNSLYTFGATKKYDASWQNITIADSSFDFSLIAGPRQAWWTVEASGADPGIGSNLSEVVPNSTSTNFLQKADNGYCYWFTANQIHKLNGGPSGGTLGTITPEILVFPEYLKCVDAIDTNGKLYIALENTPIVGATTTRNYLADVCGVYIWDRQATVLGTRDFIQLPGVREIRKIFETRDGQIRVITINNDRQTEIWGLVNSVFVNMAQLGVGAYPPFRDSMTIINNMNTWLGYDGKMYAWGKLTPQSRESLYIYGDATTQTVNTFTSGVLLSGNEPASGQQQAMFLSWVDNTTPKMSKWYPHGTGTIDTLIQNPHQGDIYTTVQQIPSFSTLDRIRIIMLPYAGSGTSAVANIKIYLNQSTTPWATKPVTANDIAKGYIEIPIRKPFVNSYQLEIEYVTSTTLGTSEFNPIYAEVIYTPEGQQKK